MCGISAILLPDPQARVDDALLARMVARQHHRGPDASGHFTDGPVGLGHNRLSILDLSAAGHQPMHSADARATIVFNGEIYNFRELRHELESRGAAFHSRTDTEVILEAWRAWGLDCLRRIEGMFAFALWNHDQQTLLAARDRLGVKPLLYAFTPHAGLAIASEAKGLLPFLSDNDTGDASASDIDPVAFHQVLLFGSAAAPRALIRGVCKLPPGHAFVVRAGQEPRPTPYWQPRFGPPLKAKPADLRAELRDRLTRAVRRQLVSDVPVGAFLSGGLDSSIVVSLMTRELPGAVNTFSVGGRGFAASELPFAKLMSDRLGVRHHPVEIDRRRFLDALPDVAWHNDEPTADPALVPLYALSKFAREHVTVALCGEGADEVFAGYAHYPAARRRLRRLRAMTRLPASLRRAAISAFSVLRGRDRARAFNRRLADYARDPFAAVTGPPPQLDRLARALTGDPSGIDAAIADRRRSLAGVPLDTADALELILRADQHHNLADFLLIRADNMAMSAGLEARVPFLDEHVVDFANRLPADQKLAGRRGKAILRDTFHDLLPPSILARPKAPFPLPLAEWVLSDPALLRDTLLGGALTTDRLLHAPALESFLTAATQNPTSPDPWHCTLAYRLLYLEIWARRVLKQERALLAA
jgi:asparagine synthase (glutamine-hydrolysing)